MLTKLNDGGAIPPITKVTGILAIFLWQLRDYKKEVKHGKIEIW